METVYIQHSLAAQAAQPFVAASPAKLKFPLINNRIPISNHPSLCGSSAMSYSPTVKDSFFSLAICFSSPAIFFSRICSAWRQLQLLSGARYRERFHGSPQNILPDIAWGMIPSTFFFPSRKSIFCHPRRDFFISLAIIVSL